MGRGEGDVEALLEPGEARASLLEDRVFTRLERLGEGGELRRRAGSGALNSLDDQPAVELRDPKLAREVAPRLVSELGELTPDPLLFDDRQMPLADQLSGGYQGFGEDWSVQVWADQGKIYREGGKPSIERSDGLRIRTDAQGLLHSPDDLPAVELPNGTRVWYHHGVLGRAAAGPELEYIQGSDEEFPSEAWGRASVIGGDGSREWHLGGERVARQGSVWERESWEREQNERAQQMMEEQMWEEQYGAGGG